MRVETTNNLEKVLPGDFLATNQRGTNTWIVPQAEFLNKYTQVSRSVWEPKPEVRQGMLVDEKTIPRSYQMNRFNDPTPLRQNELLDIVRGNTRDVRKSRNVIATQLSLHLIEVFKSQGGLKTIIKEPNTPPIGEISTPWGDTVMLHQGDWLIHNGNEVYSVAKYEFENSYTVL